MKKIGTVDIYKKIPLRVLMYSDSGVASTRTHNLAEYFAVLEP